MGNGQIDEYDEYIDKLLSLQFEASEMFGHLPTRGKVREQFLIDQINDRFKANACRGFVTEKEYESSQCDILVPTSTADMRGIGGEYRLNSKDVLVMVEVKSTLEARHIDKLNKSAQSMKETNPELMCGIYAYRTSTSAKSILKKFGFDFNEEMDIYSPDENFQPVYPNVDFVICTHSIINEGVIEDESFFVRRNSQNEKKKYVLLRSRPVTPHFFALIHSMKLADNGKLNP